MPNPALLELEKMLSQVCMIRVIPATLHKIRFKVGLKIEQEFHLIPYFYHSMPDANSLLRIKNICDFTVLY